MKNIRWKANLIQKQLVEFTRTSSATSNASVDCCADELGGSRGGGLCSRERDGGVANCGSERAGVLGGMWHGADGSCGPAETESARSSNLCSSFTAFGRTASNEHSKKSDR